MKKTIISLLLAAAMLFSLAACAGPDSKPVEAAPAPAASEAPVAQAPAASEAPAPAEATAVPMAIPKASVSGSDGDAQVQLIVDNFANLRQTTTPESWKYAVTDLDHNGRLELIAAMTHPLDRSTNLRIWELNEAKTALEPCTVQLQEDETFPEITAENADTYYDAASGTWSYAVYDNILLENSAITARCAFTLEKGAVAYKEYAFELTEGGSVRHTDADGKDISAEDYNAAVSKAFAGQMKFSTNFGWLTGEEAAKGHSLVDSYQIFTGEKAPHQDYVIPTPTPAPSASPVPSATPQPIYLWITKNPTNEYRQLSQTAYFVANATAWTSLSWTFVSPDGSTYTANDFRNIFRYCTLGGEYSTSLSIGNCTMDMHGWGVYCTFYYNDQTASTNTAYLYMSLPPQPTRTPKPTGGTYAGNVTDYNFSTVTLLLETGESVTVTRSICDCDGEIYIDAPADVYHNGVTPQGLDVYYVYIYGQTPPEPPHTYGSVAGTIAAVNSDSYVIRIEGGTATISAGICNIVSGEYAVVGCSCTVYYMDYPSVENITSVDIYGKGGGLIVPDDDEIIGEDDGEAIDGGGSFGGDTVDGGEIIEAGGNS